MFAANKPRRQRDEQRAHTEGMRRRLASHEQRHRRRPAVRWSASRTRRRPQDGGRQQVAAGSQQPAGPARHGPPGRRLLEQPAEVGEEDTREVEDLRRRPDERRPARPRRTRTPSASSGGHRRAMRAGEERYAAKITRPSSRRGRAGSRWCRGPDPRRRDQRVRERLAVEQARRVRIRAAIDSERTATRRPAETRPRVPS